MGYLKVFVLVVVYAAFVLPISAEPNNANPVQKAITEQYQIITATHEPVIEKPSQPQSTSTEQIIEKAHQYYDSALNKALTVIGISVGILAVGFIFIQFFIEWQRNKSFKTQLDEKEKQLQRYFDKRLEDETKKLEKQAKEQVDELTFKIKKDISITYGMLAHTYSIFYLKDKSSWHLTSSMILNFLSCYNDIDIRNYNLAQTVIKYIKENLSKLTAVRDIEALSIRVEELSQKVTNANDENLKKAFNEFNEAYIVRKHELGASSKDEQDLNKNCEVV